jgi:hypothetical protein
MIGAVDLFAAVALQGCRCIFVIKITQTRSANKVGFEKRVMSG